MVQRYKWEHGLEPDYWQKVSQWPVCALLPAMSNSRDLSPNNHMMVLLSISVLQPPTPTSPKGCYFHNPAARSSWEALSSPPCLASVHLTPGILPRTNQRKHDTSSLHNKYREYVSPQPHSGISRRQEAEQVSSAARVCTVNFWDGQRHLLSDAQAWQSLSYVQAWNGDSDGTKEIGRSGEGMVDKTIGAEGWIGEGFKRRKQLGLTGHMFNPSVQEAEKGRSHELKVSRV